MRLSILLLLVLVKSTFAQSPEVVLTVGHTDQVNCIAFSPDGKFILTGGNDNLSKLWDVRTAKEVRTFAGNDGRVISCKFDPSSNYVAIMDYSEKIKVWDIRSGENISSFECDVSAEYVDYAMQGKYVVFLDEDRNICLGDILTGKIDQKFELESAPHRMIVHPDGKRLFCYDYKSNLIEYDLSTGTELSRLNLFSEFMYSPTRMAFERKGRLLAISLNDNSILLYNTETKTKESTLKSHKVRIKDICFEKQGDNFYSADHNNIIVLWDIPARKVIKTLDKTVYGVTSLDTHPKEKLIAFTEYKTVHYIDPETMHELKEFTAKGNRIISMSYDQQGRYLATSTADLSIKLWDLQALKIEKRLFGFFPVEFSPNGKKLICMGTPSALYVYDPISGEKLNELPTENELIQNINVSADNRYAAGAGFMGIVKIWDLESGKLIKKLSGHVGGVYSTAFSPDGKFLASTGMDNTIIIWDLQSGNEVKRITEQHTIITHDLEFSPDGSKLAVCSWDKTITLWDTKTWNLLRRLEGHVNMITTLNFSPDGKFLATGAGNNVVSPADNSIRVWEVETGMTVCHFKNPTGAISKVIFDKAGDLLYSASDDGVAKIWDLKNCKQVAGLISVNVNDYIIETPDFYYTASKNALQAVSFRIGNKLFPFEQFDIRLNRPDIVASRIGKTPANLIKAFKYVHDKRLNRMNFKEEDLGSDFHVPEVQINNKEIPFVTDKDQIKFTVRMTDSKYNLDRVVVRVNDVPVFGPKGFDLSHLATKDIAQEITVNLIHGSNKLKVSCINEKGQESLIEEFGIIREGVAGKSNLYVVCIGVSNYQDTRFNLNYAAKDAQDMLNRFSSNNTLYKTVNSKLLINENVTKENILGVTEFLSAAGPDDIVIVFIAGHGVLDENYEYFFGTHDMNFDKPQERGVSYEQIEAIFSLLKAQRKLLIMDTCHSGELDIDEVEKNNEPSVEIKEVKFRSVGAGIRTKESFGVENTFDLMQLLFADVKAGTGTVVISSAGGAEFAMESGSWKNGLFTYCFLSSASDFKADLNSDQHMSISEIRTYTYEKVYQLSNGKQKPTTRAENLILDFFIW